MRIRYVSYGELFDIHQSLKLEERIWVDYPDEAEKLICRVYSNGCRCHKDSKTLEVNGEVIVPLSDFNLSKLNK